MVNLSTRKTWKAGVAVIKSQGMKTSIAFIGSKIPREAVSLEIHSNTDKLDSKRETAPRYTHFLPVKYNNSTPNGSP
jgi:hypothetical protein